MPDEFTPDPQRIVNRAKFFRRVHGDGIEEDTQESRDYADRLHRIFVRLDNAEKRRTKGSSWISKAFGVVGSAAVLGAVEWIVNYFSKSGGHK